MFVRTKIAKLHKIHNNDIAFNQNGSMRKQERPNVKFCFYGFYSAAGQVYMYNIKIYIFSVQRLKHSTVNANSYE